MARRQCVAETRKPGTDEWERCTSDALPGPNQHCAWHSRYFKAAQEAALHAEAGFDVDETGREITL